LVEELRPERDTSRNPLFQIAIALQNEPLPGMALEGLDVSRPVIPIADVTEFDLDIAMTRFDMELHVWEGDAGLRGTWLYDVALFDAETVAQMSRHLVEILRTTVEDPDRRISELGMLTTDEDRRLLDEWARAPRPYPRDATIHELFERQSAASPDAVALAYGDRALSYAELNARADQVARHLERLGVQPGALIALCMERSAEMIVAMLGILKSGCAYVPLDPEYPAARMTFMLEDTQAPVLVTQAALKERLPKYAGQVLCLDQEWEAVQRASDADRGPLGSPMDLAYVIYTSGSTGEPKGVAVPHRAVVRLVRDADYVPPRAEDLRHVHHHRAVQSTGPRGAECVLQPAGGVVRGGSRGRRLRAARRARRRKAAAFGARLRADGEYDVRHLV
jgi:non-ribosomal peptide synthetase component F